MDNLILGIFSMSSHLMLEILKNYVNLDTILRNLAISIPMKRMSHTKTKP